jgi:hypothetical protein
MTKKILSPKTPAQAFDEAELFYKNAKETLTKSPIKYDFYEKSKYVKEASAMGYLAALRAIDGYLLSKGVPSQKLPSSIIEYQNAVMKIPHNGRLLVTLEVVYQHLHIFAYYRGCISTMIIKEGFNRTRYIIDTLSKISNKK